MEQPCYKCGQAVEEGVAFCPHCSAPQIRVILPDPLPTPVPLADGGASAASAVLIPPPEISGAPRIGDTLKSSALAALVSLILLFFGLYPFVVMLGLGFLAVLIHRQRSPFSEMTAGLGARLGILSGLFLFGVVALILGAGSASPELRAKMHDQLIESAQKWASTYPGDQRVAAAIEQLKTPEGFIASLVVAGIMLLVFLLIVSTLAGAAAGSLFSRRGKS